MINDIAQKHYDQASRAIREAQEAHKDNAIINGAYEANYAKGGSLTQLNIIVVYIHVDKHTAELRFKPSSDITSRITNAVNSIVSLLSNINQG